MAEFVLMADDNCDLPADYYAKNDITVVKMPYTIDDKIYYSGDRTDKEFYKLLREGKMFTTIALNSEDVKAVMEPHLAAGRDVLYLAFSSGLSSTANNAMMAAKELSEKYPDRKAIVVDSLCASLGEGVFLHKANEFRKTGASIDEAAKWAEDNRDRIAHYVVADDLMHLHRGGRVSKGSAIAGSMLNIKPIINMNNEGRLIPIDKVRGRKQALISIVDKLINCAGNSKPDFFAVSHADCLEDAEFVANMISERLGIKNYIINYIGPVIGIHTGPGTVAVFLLGDHR